MDKHQLAREKPLIGISSGDPAGIGPEITVKALNESEIYRVSAPLVVGDARIITRAIEITGVKSKINVIESPEEGGSRFGVIDVLDMKNVDMELFSYGKVSGMAGKASFQYIEKVIELALSKKIDATVTGPVNKEALNQADVKYAGHTEIFADYTNTSNYAMMLAEKDFRVVHVSTHVSLLKAIKLITKERVLKIIRLAHDALTDMDIPRPRIAVNGLNPHAGENGLFGTEEADHIIPAIAEARKLGIDADGPHPPDTVFSKMKGGKYDIVVCMYHDQGHIPAKLLGFRYDSNKGLWDSVSGVNITLGLPVIRVSVDHGTAFDQAGKGTASHESMVQAIMYAANLAKKNMKE